LVEIWNATDDDSDYSAIIRLLILFGPRRTEIGSLQWSEVNLDNATLTLPAARMKHNQEHVFTLPAAAVEILRGRSRGGHEGRREGGREHVFGRTGESGFTGWSRALKGLRARILARRRAKNPKAVPMQHVVPQDFRRAVATTMNDVLDVPPHVIAEVLAHLTFKRGSEGVYNKGKLLEQKRVAVERWAQYLLAAVEEQGDVVVQMSKPQMAKPLPASRG
jgi:integrase